LKEKQPPGGPARRGESYSILRAQRDARLAVIVDMMRADTWEAKQAPILAKQWNLTEGTIRSLAGEASRVVRGAFAKEKAQIRAEVLQKLEDISDEAREIKDFAPAVAALREIKDIVGLSAPVRHEIQATVAAMTTEDLYKTLTEVQRRAKAAIAEKDADEVGLLGEGDEPHGPDPQDASMDGEGEPPAGD
jgi:hypothetical protein